jgi:hypothetical protein
MGLLMVLLLMLVELEVAVEVHGHSHRKDLRSEDLKVSVKVRARHGGHSLTMALMKVF